MPPLPGPTWQPKPEDYHRVFQEQNPWHITGAIPEAWTLGVERPLAVRLPGRLQTSALHRFQLILGPRRVGKTTAMYQMLRRLLAEGVAPRRLWWFRLDHPLLMQLPMDQLVRPAIEAAAATAESPVFLFLDELAYARQWDLWLKTLFDERWPVRLVGTSSSTAALKDRMLESGVGRWEEQYLAPYTFTEYLALAGEPSTLPAADSLWETLAAVVREPPSLASLASHRRRFLLTGGFPELLSLITDSAADEQTLLLQSQKILRTDAVERALYKDIPQTFDVTDPMLLERLLYTLAGQVCGLLSPTKIGQNLDGMARPTFDRYVSYLERAFLIFTLPNHSGSELSKQKRGRKLYFVDGAVRNAALQRGIGPLSDAVEMGLLMENLVAGHLHALAQQSGVRLYHWRDGDDEIDLVYDHPSHPVAFEIASSATHGRRGIEAFMQRFPRFAGRCYLVAPDIPALPPTQSSVGTLPLDLLLLALGAQTERELSQRLSI
jgi:predicted AAA+ superfamily ATPase